MAKNEPSLVKMDADNQDLAMHTLVMVPNLTASTVIRSG